MRRGVAALSTDDDLMTENRRRALAESYYELGETDKAEALYRVAGHGSALGLGMDRLVGLLPIHAHGAARSGAVANRSCGKGLPSRMSGTVRI